MFGWILRADSGRDASRSTCVTSCVTRFHYMYSYTDVRTEGHDAERFGDSRVGEVPGVRGLRPASLCARDVAFSSKNIASVGDKMSSH